MTGIGRLYTQDFKKLKRDGNLALIISISQTIKNGLSLLGIETVKKI